MVTKWALKIEFSGMFFNGFMKPVYIPNIFTPPNSEIICGQNVSTKVVCGIFLFSKKKAMLKI